MEIKAGVLLARSDMFPKLAMDFLNGFKLAFKAVNTDCNPKLLIESIGNATDDELLQRIEKLILQENVDVIVSFCSFFMIDKLTAIANSYQKPIIHVSLGARSLKRIHKSPYVLFQSLNLTHSSYLSGKHAVSMGKKGALLASFYDGGYHMAEAFVRGFEENGGAIVYSYVSQMDYRQDDFKAMIEGIKASAPEVLFTLFSFKEAARVLEVLTESGLSHLKVMAIPLMVDESTAVGEVNPENVQSVASWAFEEGSDEMQYFKNNYEGNYSEMPNVFGLLGNEVGTILANALRDEGKVPQQIAAYMASKTIQSPRGELRYTELNESVPKVFRVRQLSIQDAHCLNPVVAYMDGAEVEKINEKMEDLPTSGWKNPYICT